MKGGRAKNKSKNKLRKKSKKSPTGDRSLGNASHLLLAPGSIAPYCREKTTPSHVSLTGSWLLARGLTASTGARSSRAVTGHSRKTMRCLEARLAAMQAVEFI
ncbi:hypothetical protein TcCL_NonESM01465 [Trypanosoma cruzi]|nr:hypothetical protein TcCL_NonESM01465 [Trypanosoma cruzi]